MKLCGLDMLLLSDSLCQTNCQLQYTTCNIIFVAQQDSYVTFGSWSGECTGITVHLTDIVVL